jgi:hypothetical protein
LLIANSQVRVVSTNCVVVDVETDVDTVVVRDVVVMLTTSVVVVGWKLMMVSIGPGTETVCTEVSIGPGTDTVCTVVSIGPGIEIVCTEVSVGPGIEMVGPGTVCITDMKSVRVSVSVVLDTTVSVVTDVVPGTAYPLAYS